MPQFIHVRSPKVAILPGEERELFNPGMWKEPLARYLREKLSGFGHRVSHCSCEDWGRRVSIDSAPIFHEDPDVTVPGVNDDATEPPAK